MKGVHGKEVNPAVEDDSNIPEVWTDRRRFREVEVSKVEVLGVLRSRMFVGRQVMRENWKLLFVFGDVKK